MINQNLKPPMIKDNIENITIKDEIIQMRKVIKENINIIEKNIKEINDIKMKKIYGEKLIILKRTDEQLDRQEKKKENITSKDEIIQMRKVIKENRNIIKKNIKEINDIKTKKIHEEQLIILNRIDKQLDSKEKKIKKTDKRGKKEKGDKSKEYIIYIIIVIITIIVTGNILIKILKY
jgi:hypothetical protein